MVAGISGGNGTDIPTTTPAGSFAAAMCSATAPTTVQNAKATRAKHRLPRVAREAVFRAHD